MFLVVTKKMIKIFCLAAVLSIAALGCFFVTEAVSAAQPKPKFTVVLDAGHGGKDGGCKGRVTGVFESDLNLAVAKKIEKYLKVMGINVVQTRNSADGLYGTFASGFKRSDMKERAKIINKAQPDLVVSVHMNAFPQSSSRGAQVFFAPKSEESKALAAEMQRLLVKNLPHARAVSLVGNYFILECSQAPSVLVECGFLSNPEEEALLITDEYQEKLAYQIFCGIVQFFNLHETIEER